MQQSAKFRQLERRLKALRRHFLPKSFSVTGDYSPRQIDLAMAYRLLCHAEIEHHLEEASKDLAIFKVKEAKVGNVSFTVLTLVAYYKIGWGGLETDVFFEGENSKPDKSNPFKHPIGELLEDALKGYLGHVLKDNHGIRTENLKRILRPVGVDLEKLDATWITAMEDFGKSRGETAHKSSVGVSRQIDPKDEFDRVGQLLLGLMVVDAQLINLRNSKC